MKRLVGLPCAAIVMCSCQPMPPSYAPPVQRQPFEAFQAYRVRSMVHMSSPDAAARIVQDISPSNEGQWRWTGQRPTVKVKVRTTENLKFTIDFSLAEATMKDTGPVSLTFFVNGRVLERITYPKSGDYHLEKPVPVEWMAADQDAMLAVEIDKVWVAPGDGAKLGFILTRIGLTQ